MVQRHEVPITRAGLMAALFALTVALGVAGCSSDSPEVKKCKAACPIAVETVCTASGKEYANRCAAECAKETGITEGTCKASAGH